MTDTRTRILDVAEQLAQKRGFNGFSYADVAIELGVTKASLHYHFPSKAELGEALIDRYFDRFAELLEAARERYDDAPRRLAAYAELYAETLRGDRMCLCGMLAAEIETLPSPMRHAVVRFFDANEEWVEEILREGVEQDELRLAGNARDEARLFVSSLQGAVLVARPYGDPERFVRAAERLVASLAPAA
jgi:TetR/AcrR family transcriptional repressor of nem operon